MHRLMSIFGPGLFFAISLFHFVKSCNESYKKPYPAKEFELVEKFSYVQTLSYGAEDYLEVQGPRGIEKYPYAEEIIARLDSATRRDAYYWYALSIDSIHNNLKLFPFSEPDLAGRKAAMNEEGPFVVSRKIDSLRSFKFKYRPFCLAGYGLLGRAGDSLFQLINRESEPFEDLEAGDRHEIYFDYEGSTSDGKHLARLIAVDPWFRPWRRDSDGIAGMWIYGIIGGFSGFVTLYNLARGGQPSPFEEERRQKE